LQNPRRSVLFVPGSSLRMLEKARDLQCDVVVLDLEDSVAPEAKDAARDAACAAVKSYGRREVVVRINRIGAPWHQADLNAVRAAGPDAILLPKVEKAADIEAVKGSFPVWAMIETPLGVLNAPAIAAGGAACLCLGTNDLLKAMRAQPLPDRRNLWPALTATVLAARAHGASVIDGTYNDIANQAGFAESCAQGRAFGFDGKTLIHPSQIESCNRIFAPSPKEVAQARRIIAAFEHNPGKGAIALDGQMIERLHAEEAQRILALHQTIESGM
jgi:citrate lyase subunit beta / citryl-CoA lyase